MFSSSVDSSVSLWLKAAVKNCLGLNPDAFSGHSLRRGGATALFLAGVSEHWIAIHGRWRSNAYKLYIDIPITSRALPTLALAMADDAAQPTPIAREPIACTGFIGIDTEPITY